ncbi:methionyl-tRNA formyltransferase [Aspergillus candidus]|uniref:methionyl-tRNA formyltransferase n=1 Tax=Aspergillus candidus TaxID=41067 RepID=A0A2I2FMB8_ASPCN|nr:Formyltransferase [Aspergillus candidus]PLB41765.1 Formyltransferase [Aspergillus candidus]
MFLLRSSGILCASTRTRPLIALPSLARRWYSTSKPHEPLRILFCGSDEFSIASLEALHREHVREPRRISSIDVVCRPGKRVGRGLKKIREVPIKAVASKLSLPIHEIDTFRGWTPPTPVNLIVAVSFGLFVPSRILNSSTYGGLNIHPSLLPDFRGPAPLHHTLLAGRRTTGVTLQTLDVKHFDHGVILSQTPPLPIPNPDSCTVPELLDLVTPTGANLLVEGIQKGLFVPPLEDVGPTRDDASLIHAAKITPEDRHVDWANWTALEISRRTRVLGPLWSNALAADTSGKTPTFRPRRVIFTEIEEVEPPKGCEMLVVIPGVPFVDNTQPKPTDRGLYVFTRDGKLIRIRQMKVEGEQNADAVRAALKAKMVGPRTLRSGYTPFYNPLQ